MSGSMPSLPHGWRIHNKEGDVSGPPIPDHDSEDGESEDLDIKPDSEGWEDLEDDTEALAIKCLLCSDYFPLADHMIDHCKTTHDFDFLKTRRDLGLDFYATIKFVNYIRSEVQSGKDRPDVSSTAAWADDKFLQPVLEDDALLFTLDDLIDGLETPELSTATSS